MNAEKNLELEIKNILLADGWEEGAFGVISADMPGGGSMNLTSVIASVVRKLKEPEEQASNYGEFGGVKQMFDAKSDCYADIDNGLPIPAMTWSAFRSLIEWHDAQKRTQTLNAVRGIIEAETKNQQQEIKDWNVSPSKGKYCLDSINRMLSQINKLQP